MLHKFFWGLDFFLFSKRIFGPSTDFCPEVWLEKQFFCNKSKNFVQKVFRPLGPISLSFPNSPVTNLFFSWAVFNKKKPSLVIECDKNLRWSESNKNFNFQHNFKNLPTFRLFLTKIRTICFDAFSAIKVATLMQLKMNN